MGMTAGVATAMYANPSQQYVAPQGSYVSAPAALPVATGAMPCAASATLAPQMQPQSLTAGMPDPKAIETQKVAYSKSLEEQAAHGEDMLRMQKEEQIDQIYQAAEARKRQLMVEIDQQAKQQELQLSQQYSPQVMGLQQEYHHQKLILEKQANDLTLEYHQRKAQEDLMLQQYEVQRQHYDEQMGICNEMQTNVHAHHVHAQQMQMGGVAGGGSYVPPLEACAGQVLPQAPSCVAPPTQYAGT